MRVRSTNPRTPRRILAQVLETDRIHIERSLIAIHQTRLGNNYIIKPSELLQKFYNFRVLWIVLPIFLTT